MDGLMALKEIKALDPQARVVMLTALGQDSVVLEAMRFGALDFLLKPFESNRVLSTVNKALSAPITA
jgi:two-component system chemotaxis response regulator CheY